MLFIPFVLRAANKCAEYSVKNMLTYLRVAAFECRQAIKGHLNSSWHNIVHLHDQTNVTITLRTRNKGKLTQNE